MIIITASFISSYTTDTDPRLLCDLGVFTIKDKRLKALPKGQHEGFFEILKLTPCCFLEEDEERPGISVRTEMVADIGKFTLSTSELTQPLSSSNTVNAVESNHQTKLLPLVDETASGSEADAKLFKDFWPLEAKIKLDPNIGRDLFDKQRSRLKELKYKFDHHEQAWYRNIS